MKCIFKYIAHTPLPQWNIDYAKWPSLIQFLSDILLTIKSKDWRCPTDDQNKEFQKWFLQLLLTLFNLRKNFKQYILSNDSRSPCNYNVNSNIHLFPNFNTLNWLKQTFWACNHCNTSRVLQTVWGNTLWRNRLQKMTSWLLQKLRRRSINSFGTTWSNNAPCNPLQRDSLTSSS